MIEEEVEDLEELGEDEPEQEQEMYEHFRLEVDPGQNLLRIDRFLVDRLPNVSRTKIQEAAEAQCVLVNNKPVKSNYRVPRGRVCGGHTKEHAYAQGYP